jgi:hypothetical protein
MTAINLPISCAEVYWCIADSESVNSTDIAQKTGLAKSTVQGHLSALEKGNAILSQGRPKQYCVSNNISSEILDWLKEFEELARAAQGLRKRTYVISDIAETEPVFELTRQNIYSSEPNTAERINNSLGEESEEKTVDTLNSRIYSCVNGLKIEGSDLLHLISATTVLEEIAQVSSEVVGKTPLGEDYKGFLLLPALSEHGWRCDFSMPDGSFRQGSAGHSFPEYALTWGREVIDTGRVNVKDNQQRSFTDEALIVRPFQSLLDSAFRQYFSSRERRVSLLADFLMLQFGNQGQTSFWDDVLAYTVRLQPRQLTKHLNELSHLGILRYFRPPNRNCPTSYYLGPAWLSVQEVSLTETELEAIEDGEMNREDGYLWGIPFGERSSQGARILQQEGNAIVRVPNEPGEPFWRSTWSAGEWTHQRKANENSELEPPSEKRITRAELQTAFRQLRRVETYMGHLLSSMPCVKNNKLAWYCDIDLENGLRFHGSSSKSFDSVDEALNWGKRIIDKADSPFNNEGQGLAQPSNSTQSFLMSSVEVMLQKYLPKATDSHSLVLKHLLKQFQNQGTDELWDYFLARGFALTSRSFLSICRDLAKSGLIRYSRYSAAHMMDFYLGPAWLSLEGVALHEQELQAIVRGEQVASYHPWRKSNESYPGEKYGFPCMERSERNIGYFHEGFGMPAKWIFRQEGNTLMRVPLNPHYPIWYSTWQDGFWTHRSSDFVKEDSPENSEWFGRGAVTLGLSTVVANSDFL